MPKYRAKVKLLLAHESRVVDAGEEFETTFPKAKTADGKEVDMKLGDNIELVPVKKADDKKADDKKAADLV